MNLNLRLATEADCKLLFDWANDSEVRKASFNTEKIEWSDHSNWFLQKINTRDSLILILEVDGTPAGQIRFDKDLIENIFLVSFLMSEKFRGKSLGSVLISMGVDYLISIKQMPISVVGLVKKENTPSQIAFRKNQFLLESESDQILIFKKVVAN